MNNKICVILYGRQNIEVYKNILDIIDYLNSDVFLVYDNDICNYSKHHKLIEKIYTNNINGICREDSQYLKIKIGWQLMEKYENKKKFKYDYVFRLRCDVLYRLNKNIDFTLIKKNKVYLNSDYLFYGLRNEVKNCFLLYDLWHELRLNKINLYNIINISHLIKIIKSHPDQCFDFNSWNYYNKIKSIPVPVLKSIKIKKSNFGKNETLKILHNLNKKYINYKEVLKSNNYKLTFLSKKEKYHIFPCELSILLVLLSKNIIPCHSKFIEVIKKM